MTYTIIDSLIYTGVVLLVLSQVCEKITTFIRNYLVSSKISVQGKLKHRKITKIIRYYINKAIKWLLSIILILDTESDIQRGKSGDVPKDQQPRVEFAITKLSLLVGFLLALLFHADLFKILGGKNPPHEVLHWGKGLVNFKDCLWNLIVKHNTEAWDSFKPLIGPCIETFFGCLATGFLLTFGSKFFHDLLEILYEIKRAKRNLEDERVYRSQDLVTLKERIASPLGDPVSIVLERHKTILLKRYKTIISIERTFNAQGESLLEIFTLDDSERKFIESYRFDYPDRNGDKILSMSQLKITSGYSEVKIHNQVKLSIGNRAGPVNKPPFEENYGTLGFFALRRSDKAKIFVTCAHVMDANPAAIDLNQEVWAEDDSYNRVIVGKLSEYKMDEWLDAVVINLNPDVLPMNFDPDKKLPFTKSRELDWDDQPDIWVNGGTSLWPRHGRVLSHQNAVQVNYGSETRVLYNLIKMSADGPKPVSDRGDSGAVVFDLEMNAVGMIVAGNEEASYAIPFQRILTDFEIMLPNNTSSPK